MLSLKRIKNVIKNFSTWLIFITTCVSGQNASYYPSHFTDENGLLQNVSYQIGTNQTGFIWIRSQYGLARLDGKHVRNYLNSFYFPSSQNKFSHIFWDVDANFYAYNDRHKKELFQLNICPERVEADSIFFISGFQQLLFPNRIAKNNRDTAIAFLKGGNSFYYTPHRELYVFEKRSVNYFDDSGQLKRIAINGDFKATPVNDYVVISNKNQTVGYLYKGTLIKIKWEHDKVSALNAMTIVNPSGTYIIFNNALYGLLIENERPTIRLFIQNINVPDVSDVLFEKQTGAIVISSFTDGVYVFKKQNFRSVVSTSNYTYINNFYEQTEFSDGRIFSAEAIVDSNGVVHPQNKLKVVSHSALMSTPKKELYFTYGSFLFKTTEELNSVKRIAEISGPARSFFYAQDTLWMASKDQLGYIQDDTLTNVYNIANKNDPPDITSACNSSATLFAGTENGLYALNKTSKKATEIPELKGKAISCLVEVANATIFIGTRGRGAFVYKEGKCIPLPADKNNATSTVNAAIADKNNFLWMSTNKGLLKARTDEINKLFQDSSYPIYYYSYYKQEGFATNEFNNAMTAAVLVKKNGLFSFSSLKGLVWFDPLHMKPGDFPTDFFIEELNVDGKHVEVSNDIELFPNYNTLNVKVILSYWGERNNVELSYTLSDMHNTWYPVEESGMIYLNKLRPGEYVLKIRVRTGFYNTDFLEKQLLLKILPAWYETTIFRIACVLLLILMVYCLFRWRMSSVRKDRIKLERTVKEKTKELNETIGELGDTIIKLTTSQQELSTVIEEKEKLTSILAHDLRTPLKFIAMITEHLSTDIDSLSKDKLKRIIMELKSSTQNTFDFADELLSWLAMRNNTFKLKIKEENIVKLIQHLHASFIHLANARNIKFVFQPDRDIFVATDERLLKIILRNIIDNSIKYSNAGIIGIQAAIVEKELIIEIYDTGNGMTEENLNEIGQDGSLGLAYDKNKKLGLQIIKDLVKKLNGHLVITSKLNVGTTVVLHLPLEIED